MSGRFISLMVSQLAQKEIVRIYQRVIAYLLLLFARQISGSQ